MRAFAIGDVQGCYQELRQLLTLIDYKENDCQLYFCGDLVNRGPNSLDVLRFLSDQAIKPIITLGNHDIHLLAVANGHAKLRKKDTFSDILNAADGSELCRWLQQQKIVHYDEALQFFLVHAGIPPQWDKAKTLALGAEVEHALQSANSADYFKHLYGDQPDCWQDDLTGPERLRLITNYFTRMRFCDPKGRLELTAKSGLKHAPKGYYPWFALPERKLAKQDILFGHWASLKGKANTEHVYALDSGCVWGRQLSALCLHSKHWFRVDAIKS